LPGTFYLTHVDKAHRRFYKIKEADDQEQSLEKSFNWSGDLKPHKTSMKEELVIVDDSTLVEMTINKIPSLRRLNHIDSQFVS
jgi:hypothetical protein